LITVFCFLLLGSQRFSRYTRGFIFHLVRIEWCERYHKVHQPWNSRVVEPSEACGCPYDEA